MLIMRKFFIGLLILFLPLLFINEGLSSSNTYFIEKIKCYSESTSSAKAKEDAIKKAEKEALKKLFARLNVNQENINFINSEVLARVVDSIRVSDEVLTATKYSSTVDILFNKEFIDYYLNQYHIKNGEIIEKKYLYIPILKVDDNYYNLVNNIWRDKTLLNIEDLQLRGFELPHGFNVLNQNPINDVLINKKTLEFPDYNNFLELLKEHKSNVLVFSIAEYFKESDNVEITLKEVLTDNISETKLNLFNKENLAYEDLMSDASYKTIKFFFKKNLSNVSNQQTNNTKKVDESKLKVYILQSDLQDAVFMSNLLKSLSFITNSKLDYQTTKESCFDIEVNIDQEKLFSAFKENGILMQFKNSKYYLIYIGM